MSSETGNLQPKSKVRKQSITPLLVRHIQSCSQQDFKLFGIPIHISCVVGIIKGVKFEQSQLTCSIEDFTGTMKAVMCFETETEMRSKSCNFVENRYAQVYGTVRQESDKILFTIIQILPVDDANVIITHLLHVIASCLEAESKLKMQVSAASITGTALANALVSTDDTLGSTISSHLSSFQTAILNIIQGEVSHDGIKRENILMHFPSHQSNNVNQALEYLTGQGLIYLTTDQNHFKVVSNF